MFKKLVLGALIIAGLTQVASADMYEIDRGHSSVGFSVSHMTISKVKGSFNDFAGTINFDPADVAKSSVDVTIQTASVDTRSENRDNHLKSGDFFAADSFPTITFKSTAVTAKPDGTFDLTGDLTMRGVTKPVTLTVTKTGELEDPKRGKLYGFNATGKLNRQDYGVSYSNLLDNGGLVVGNDVWLEFDIEARTPREKKPTQ